MKSFTIAALLVALFAVEANAGKHWWNKDKEEPVAPPKPTPKPKVKPEPEVVVVEPEEKEEEV